MKPSKVVGYFFKGLLLIFIFYLPILLKNNYYIHMLNIAVVYIIAVYGLNFITGMTGQMNLGSAGIFALGAYTTTLLSMKLNVSPWLAMIAVVFIGFLAGIGLGFPSLRLKGVYLSLTTIGFTEIVRLFTNNMTSLTNGAVGIRGIPPYNLFGVDLGRPPNFYYFIVVVCLLLTLLVHRIIASKWGRAFIAIKDNIDAVEVCGINVVKIKMTAFCLAAIFCAVSGALYAHCQKYISPLSFTSDLSITMVVMLMLGGRGKISGCIVGAVVVTVLPELLRGLGDYYQIVFYTTILILAIFLPGGLVNLFVQSKKNFVEKLVAKS